MLDGAPTWIRRVGLAVFLGGLAGGVLAVPFRRGALAGAGFLVASAGAFGLAWYVDAFPAHAEQYWPPRELRQTPYGPGRYLVAGIVSFLAGVGFLVTASGG